MQGRVSYSGGGMSQFPHTPYHFRENEYMHGQHPSFPTSYHFRENEYNYAWTKVALSLTSNSLRDLLRDTYVHIKYLGQRACTPALLTRAHRKIQPNFDTLRI